MSEESTGTPVDDGIAVITPASDTAATLSLSDAARALNAARRPKQAPAAVAEEAAPVEQPELDAQAPDADPEKVPGEDATEVDPAELPPLDPPRSWTKAEKERFQALPRETQEYLHTREQERDREIRRTQNDAADKSKALQAQLEQTEKARQEYDAKIMAAREVLEREQLRDFPDIKSSDDIERLAREAQRVSTEDPFRALQINTYLQAWNAHQQRMQAVAWESQQVTARKAQEQQQQTRARKVAQHALLLEKAPELADQTKLASAQTAVVELLRDKDFNDAELGEIAANPLMDDHRIQLALWEAAKYRELQKAPPKAIAKPVPPVTRPGTSRPSGSAVTEHAQALTSKLTTSGSLKDAQALRALQLSRRA